ncbi:MAG TPA: fatty acid-binding protein DegV [Bacteroidales bacterium]|nr:fatty acid-binding protein DegV [Bacteroidales bacterium]HBQ82204.1 fatty acid-binding protein DegV [Bacteroidales bacterium]HCU17659.1 fatty acid-binding protein DegV [Bacteroidales bacterium]
MAIASQVPLVEMDGRRLYYTFIAGARKVIEHQVELNKINVFPVNDGDTGTNLASTIRAVIDSLHPHKSYKVTADRIAETSLVNARGNSGIIFAQFLYGMSMETGNFKTITIAQFAESIKNSIRYIYEAIANPVEGTMLTVIREWADYIYDNRHRIKDFNELFLGSSSILNKSLIETKSRLEVLRKANVVDAGARGFVLFIEGIIEFITRRNIKELIQARTETVLFEKIEESIPQNVEFRFCTEALIKNCIADSKTMHSILNKYGDSIVVAGSDRMKRLHVHTNTPALLFNELRKTGTIAFQKADDMIRQSDVVYNRKWKIALVTDSTCDLSQDLIDQYQINILPININFGENNYLDKVTIQPEQFYTLLEENVDYPKSAQVNEKAFTNLYSHLASHYDSIIAIHLSDKLSGTFGSSQKAAKAINREFNKPISVINSKNLSGALGLIILRAARAIEDGCSHEKVVELAEEWVKNVKILVSVKDLKYLIRGGRLSSTKGLIARILNVNPIVSIDEDGKAIVFDKSFNQRATMEKVISYVKKLTTGKQIWNYIVLHAQNDEAAQWYSDRMEEITSRKPVSVVNISPVIGANTGIGAAAVAFLPE